jgi:hypothetical protein
MHDRLSELLDVEVIGEVTRVGDLFFDVGHGRICVDPLDRGTIELLLQRLREAFDPETVQIRDQLFLEDPTQMIRGKVDIFLQDPVLGSRYRLEISSQLLFEFYERRFMIAPEVLGDLAGTLVGLHALIARGRQAPLQVLSGFDALIERYLERLDRVLQAALFEQELDVGPWIEELLEPLRRSWRVIPWPLKTGLEPTTHPKERVCQHDQVLRHTVLFAVNVTTGEPVYEYVHQHNELEEYEQVLSWMTEIYKAMCESYPAPDHGTVMARASSRQRFIKHFPGLSGIVGQRELTDDG